MKKIIYMKIRKENALMNITCIPSVSCFYTSLHNLNKEIKPNKIKSNSRIKPKSL